MENDTCVEHKHGGAAVDQVRQPAAITPYGYTKEELLEIKELPVSNERPDCLSEKYVSDGIWDPEKWHASLYPTKERSSPVEVFKDYVDDRVPLKRRIPDPREWLKEDDLDVILSPQRRSFGGGCQGNAALALHPRRPISSLDNQENENLLGGARRIGSGRIIAAQAFEREACAQKEREREKDYKDKRFRRDFGDKRVFGERRRNDSYAEEPEWFSGGPTSQSETIELIGFDDKILEDDKRRSRRAESIREAVEFNDGQVEERDAGLQPSADQEVPHPVLPEQMTGEFNFNEFFNLEKTMPGLASLPSDPAVVTMSGAQALPQQQKNILQELLGGPVHSGSPTLLGNLLSSSEGPTTSTPLPFPSPDYFNSRLQLSAGFPGHHMLPQQYADVHRSVSPGSAAQQQMRVLSRPVNQADLKALTFRRDLLLHGHRSFQSCYKSPQDKSYRNGLQGVSHSPWPGPQSAGRNSTGNPVTSMLSPSFTPTSVIRKMYATKEKSRAGPLSRLENEDAAGLSQDDCSTPTLFLPPSASSPIPLALMQQRSMHPGILGSQSQSHGPHWTNGSQQHWGAPPLGLAKWFGSDMLEQPLPSMPAKVISVDELEFRP